MWFQKISLFADIVIDPIVLHENQLDTHLPLAKGGEEEGMQTSKIMSDGK